MRVLVASLLAPLLLAQTTPRAEFEVASIRETLTGVSVMNTFESSGSRAQYHGFGIPSLVAEAWNVRANEVEFGPALDPAKLLPKMSQGSSARIYEIAALAPEGSTPTRDQFRLMLQSLLAERFKLATHIEKRELAVYVLSTNGTPRLKPSASQEPCRIAASRTPEGQRLVAANCPIRMLVSGLFVDRPLYDDTGLTGFYDFEITSALPSQTNDQLAVTPFSAVKDLGLKLEPKQRPVDVIVIDHVETPDEN
jgi:uncharacterized protein (TIGR03435 family)